MSTPPVPKTGLHPQETDFDPLRYVPRSVLLSQNRPSASPFPFLNFFPTQFFLEKRRNNQFPPPPPSFPLRLGLSFLVNFFEVPSCAWIENMFFRLPDWTGRVRGVRFLFYPLFVPVSSRPVDFCEPSPPPLNQKLFEFVPWSSPPPMFGILPFLLDHCIRLF